MMKLKEFRVLKVKGRIKGRCVIDSEDNHYYFVENTKVRRGPTWEWQDQDCLRGGEQQIGTITDIQDTGADCWMRVKWYQVYNNSYRVGCMSDQARIYMDVLPVDQIYSAALYEKIHRGRDGVIEICYKAGE